MNRYYKAFKERVSWFNYKNEAIEIFEISQFKLTKRFQKIFPVTTLLINESTKTGIQFKEKSLILFTWEIGDKLCGWMSQFDSPKIELIEEHKILIENIGGIVEYFNGPGPILLNGINYNYSLTQNQYFMFVGLQCHTEGKLDWKDYYIERCKKFGFEPIDLTKKVFFTREANGAQYFYDIETKNVKLFSHDHNFKFVEFLPNQPEYTMHKIKGVNEFVDFVELVANQWRIQIENKKKTAEDTV